jgi:hypothetical protein
MAETELILDRDTVIGGLPCAKGTEAVLYGEERPRIVMLSRATKIGPIPCAAGSRLFLHPNARVCNARLARKVKVNGVALSKGSRATLLPEGTLLEYSTHPSVDLLIQEIPCRGGHRTWFYREGRLSRGVLSKKHRFGRRELPAGTTFTLGADGSLIESTPPPPRGTRYKERLYGAVEIPVL